MKKRIFIIFIIQIVLISNLAVILSASIYEEKLLEKLEENPEDPKTLKKVAIHYFNDEIYEKAYQYFKKLEDTNKIKDKEKYLMYIAGTYIEQYRKDSWQKLHNLRNSYLVTSKEIKCHNSKFFVPQHWMILDSKMSNYSSLTKQLNKINFRQDRSHLPDNSYNDLKAVTAYRLPTSVKRGWIMGGNDLNITFYIGASTQPITGLGGGGRTSSSKSQFADKIVVRRSVGSYSRRRYRYKELLNIFSYIQYKYNNMEDNGEIKDLEFIIYEPSKDTSLPSQYKKVKYSKSLAIDEGYKSMGYIEFNKIITDPDNEKIIQKNIIFYTRLDNGNSLIVVHAKFNNENNNVYFKEIEKMVSSIRILYENIDSVNISRNNDELVMSVRKNDLVNVLRLIDLGVDINQPDSMNQTALTMASFRGNYDMIKLLIENGADVNAIAKDGNTALINAVKRNKLKIIKLLMDNGADPSIKNNEGKTALEIAVGRNNYEEILNLLHKK